MKFLLFFTLLALLVVGLHASEPDAITFPSCALACDKALFSECSLSNKTCFCESNTRPTALLDCAASNCTTKEYFTTRRLYEQKCDITPLKGPSVVEGATLVPLIFATFFFVARIMAKSGGLAGGWGWDDYTIIISFVLGIAIYVLNSYMIRFGFGQNIWDVPFDDITKFYQLFQGLAVMYKLQISLAKISVCLFLLRIFQSRTFRYMAYALIGINAATGITWACVDSFRCLPTHLTWTGWMNEEEGHCIDFISSILVNCLVNIFVDSIMIVMPVYEVVQLQLPLKKKLTVALMFVVGSLLTIIAIIRVVVFWNHRWGANQTLGLYPLIHWSVIETQIAIMCACLPAFRALIGRWFPGLLGGSRGRTYPSNAAEYVRQTEGNSNINKSVSYSVNYASRSENSVVELVDVDRKYGR
ncbi:uncharacterized protein N7446_003380 [Penicillium canescens]|uniref:Extracellular membrane protein CFEM domain-containing protein n=1 Tax=Penicillium canescens TaxID=5083 RepID=A0AAD6NAB1_PENCN|nr:uncharacterized protein N7446_003380 [Penicillium canescens]KAJ6045178.1 hypothetical protein N7460_006533 [Penicillium canescens]KAJ6056648.1 hypothetical protein N7444_005746 [Penicillium canescens]KAJ6075603.1 hypothetical protein N7446_003380 [Penicillium canescens]